MFTAKHCSSMPPDIHCSIMFPSTYCLFMTQTIHCPTMFSTAHCLVRRTFQNIQSVVLDEEQRFHPTTGIWYKNCKISLAVLVCGRCLGKWNYLFVYGDVHRGTCVSSIDNQPVERGCISGSQIDSASHVRYSLRTQKSKGVCDEKATRSGFNFFSLHPNLAADLYHILSMMKMSSAFHSGFGSIDTMALIHSFVGLHNSKHTFTRLYRKSQHETTQNALNWLWIQSLQPSKTKEGLTSKCMLFFACRSPKRISILLRRC